MKEQMLDANFPCDAEGRTYHVGTKPGEVANRIITVGDYTRARRIAASFDGGKPVFEHESGRKFLTLTGTYRNIPITVIAIGMGFSLIDFFVRECRAVLNGQMVIVRLGSCGSLSDRADIGTVVVPYESVGVLRNYDFFTGDNAGDPYIVTKPLPCDREIHDALRSALQSSIPLASDKLFDGRQVQVLDRIKNASADSFYSSQGRQSSLFRDDNKNLVSHLQKKFPGVQTFEMETYLLNHLAIAANESESVKSGSQGQLRTGAVQMVFANRESKRFIAPAEVELLETWCGRAVCEGLASLSIPEQELHGTGVWDAK